MKTEFIKAIIGVMSEVESIEKNTTVGEGKYAYSAVSDKDVKRAIGKAMQLHGIVCLPIKIEPTFKIERWEENGKIKQSVFCEVKATYLLCHEAGTLEIQGYGHGIDSQDKAAGKATTYALKNALLYSFLVPTGSLDDSDKEHSNNIATPQIQPEIVWMSESLFNDFKEKIESALFESDINAIAEEIATWNTEEKKMKTAYRQELLTLYKNKLETLKK